MVLDTIILGATLFMGRAPVQQSSYPLPQSVEMQSSTRIGREEEATHDLMRRYGVRVKLNPYVRE